MARPYAAGRKGGVDLKILVACEESQTATKAFRSFGHEAFSCDIQACSGGHPEWHIQDDARELLKFRWDMILAHPPCTYLSNAGANRLRIDGEIQEERMQKAREAKTFFLAFLNADCPKICVENPVPGAIHGLPPYSQIINPYQFGDAWLKRTCLWLRGLPPLLSTDLCVPEGRWVLATPHGHNENFGDWPLKGFRSAKQRSKSFPGIAQAMAEQWTAGVFPWMHENCLVTPQEPITK